MPLLFETDGKSVKVYHYVPSDVAGYIFMAAFGFGAIAHTFELFRLKARHFIPMIIGCIIETFGYYGRVWSHRAPKDFGPFVLQAMLILIAPVFIAATIYMTLGRIITALDAGNHASIRPKWLTKVFLLGDIICFIVQIGGAGMQATIDIEIQKIGVKVTLTGLIIQTCIFVWFLIIAMLFHRRLNAQPTHITEGGNLRWRKYLWTLYLASTLTLVRNIVRVFEYAQGFNGFIMKHEAMLYFFDALLMTIVVYAYLIAHPARLIKLVRRTESGKLMGDSTQIMILDERK